MTRTLILAFHPNLAGARTHGALAAAAARLPGVEIVDEAALYPDGRIDVDAEVARLLAADRVVLQFPVQWYSTPPLLKAWQDAVLTRMMYLAYDMEGARLAGKPLLVAATAGNMPEAYTPQGQNRFPLEELLRPLEATAHRCGLVWERPFLLYRAGRLNDAELAQAAEDYRRGLGAWIAAASVRSRAA
ncbi:NAD(P)H-dependent oxidoreductase [Phenylobacterium sp.]|uniref:NAD(P)H-dependent oxidoreductase n=1 Tax=Phenylobacterium sp. TaxID=1871053 RepID=UPI0035B1A7C6